MSELSDGDVVGGIDFHEPHIVKGWAASRSTPDKKMVVGIVDEAGDVVAVGQTGAERDDVRAAYGFVDAGFEIDLPPQFAKVLQVSVSSRLGGGAVWSPIGPSISMPREVFYVEAFEKEYVSGWIVCHPGSQPKIKIGLEVDEHSVAEVGTTLPREDVAQVYNMALKTGFYLPIPYRLSHIGLSTYRLYAELNGDKSTLAAGCFADLKSSKRASRFEFDPVNRSWMKTNEFL